MTISILKTVLAENKVLSKKNFLGLLSSLVEQISDEPSLGYNFATSGGLTFLSNYFEGKAIEDSEEKTTTEKDKKKIHEENLLLNKFLLNLLSNLVLCPKFLQEFVFFAFYEETTPSTSLIIEKNDKKMLNFYSLVEFKYLLEEAEHLELVRYHYSILFNLLETYEQVFPTDFKESSNLPSPPVTSAASYSEALFEKKINLTFNENLSKLILKNLQKNLLLNKNDFQITFDFFSSFLTTNFSYKDGSLLSMSGEISAEERNETLEKRKIKNKKKEISSFRAYQHSIWAIECGFLDSLMGLIDDDNSSVRRSSATALGVLLRAIDQYTGPREEALKQFRLKEKTKELKSKNLEVNEEKLNEDDKKNLTTIQKIILPYIPGHEFETSAPPECNCFGPCGSSCATGSLSFLKLKKRAALEAALLSTNLDLGAWVVNHPSGGNGRQLLRLASCPYTQGVEAACEVFCLAANNDTLTGLLINLSNEKVFENLISNSLDPSIKAAAASTILKLTVKTKAAITGSSTGGLSPEVYQSLTAANQIIKSHLELQEKNKKNPNENKQTLTSFSNFDNSSQKDSKSTKTESQQLLLNNSTVMTPLERSIEALAILSKNFKIKQFMCKEIIQNISKIDLEDVSLIDSNSSCRFGVAHILSSITVTNRELLALALREKEMTIDQYEKMKELQRVSAKTDDEAASALLKDNLEDLDEDTPAMCKIRIKLCVDGGALKSLTAILNSIVKASSMISTSVLALENAVRALRQICVNEAVRGLFIQSGAFQACVDVSLNTTIPASIRREAAHAVSKSLVTTNPHLFSEPVRLGAIRSLIFLCREVDASNLQQFEALLALTNLLSCGEAEQDRLVANNNQGLNAIQYLMFSDHKMVARAATEALCNMAGHEALLKVLATKDKIKIWLGFCEGIFDYTENGEKIEVTSIGSLPDEDKYYALANDTESEEFKTASAASGTLASACDDPDVALILLQEDVARTIAILIKSKAIPLLHRALVIALGLIQGKHAKLAAQQFSSKDFLSLLFSLPAVSPIEEIAQEFIQTLSALVKK